MSKSYENYIALSDSKKTIKEKVRAMITDPRRVKLTDRGNPDICNVYSYYKIFKPKMKDEIYDWCKKARCGCTECKQKLADVLVDFLSDIHCRREELLKDKDKIYFYLQKGARKAKEIAVQTIKEAKKAIGL